MSIEIPPEYQYLDDDTSACEDWRPGLMYDYPNQDYAAGIMDRIDIESTIYEYGCDIDRPEPNGLNDFWTVEDAGDPR